MRLSEWLEDEKEMATEAARAEGLEHGLEQGNLRLLFHWYAKK